MPDSLSGPNDWGTAMSLGGWESKDELLRTARDRSTTDPIALPIRSLLAYWGAKARGAVIVATIRHELRQAGLATDPDFTSGWIDNSIRLVGAPASDASPDAVQEVSLKVGNLRTASQGVVCVQPDDSLEKAATLMTLRDFSQLAVASTPRSVLGVISWESIGRFQLARELVTVRDATVDAEEVRLEHDLLPLLPKIAAAGYVLVRAADNTLSGIITAADVTEEFDALASPFFLLGEIERRLRLVVAEYFEPSELAKYRDPDDDDRSVAGADDLSLGEIARLLERPDVWSRLGWNADRVAFGHALYEVRGIRNRLMHFSPDLPTADEITQMRNLLAFVKVVTP